jgi:hypothetical protein
MKLRALIILKIIIFLLPFCYAQNNELREPPRFVSGVQRDNKTKLFGIIGKDLEVMVPFEYEELDPTVSNFMIAKKKGKCGVINSKNTIIHEFKYDHIWFGAPYLIGTIGKDNIRSCTVIDTSKGVLIPLSKGYNYIEYARNYMLNKTYFKAMIFQKNVTDIYDLNGQLIKHYPYSSVNEWDGNYLIVTLNGRKGIVDVEGQLLLKPVYNHIDWIDDNKACVYDDLNKPLAQVIDLSTKKVISNKYNKIKRREDNGYMIVSHYIDDKLFNGIISPEFKEVYLLCDCIIEYNYKANYFEVTNNINQETTILTLDDLKKK